MMKGQLLFVYNAKSNLLNKTFDFLHKLVSPQTYNCNLCLLTHDNFSERKEWTDFRNSLGIELKFLYSDNFEVDFPMEKTDYPVVYMKSGIMLNKLVSANELNSLSDLKGLIQLLTERLKVQPI